MSAATTINDDLFDGGPPLRWQRKLGLVKPTQRQLLRRIELIALAAWFPMAVLAIAESMVLNDNTAKAFLTDFACYQRFLVAVPFFILAESDCIPRLGAVARQFLASGMIRDQDRARYDNALASTRRLLDSKAAEVLVVVIAYAIVIAMINFVPVGIRSPWQRSESGFMGLSWPAWWLALVSVPLMLVLIIGWLWRIILWGRFLWLMEHLDLLLIPGHPDHVGGLKFISSSLRGFRLLAFAFGNIVAGTVANRVRDGASPMAFKQLVIGLIIFILILSVGPLTIFIRKIRSAKRRGMFTYGALAASLGLQFEQKWLKQAGSLDRQVLEVPDFSATVDLFGVVSNVYEMKDIPFGWKNVAPLVVSTLLPFIPVALLVFPLKEILKDVAKLLI